MIQAFLSKKSVLKKSKSKARRPKEIVETRGEINLKTVERINETKSRFSGSVN